MPVTREYEAEDYEINIRAAERSHDDQARSLAAMQAAVIRLGSEALRVAALASGGSAAAMLAFICSLVAHGNAELASWLPWSLRAFVIALLCACVGFGTTYFAQLFHTGALKRQTYVWEYPYVENAPGSASRARLGTTFNLLTAMLTIASYVALAVGYLAAYRAIGIVGFK